MFLLELLQVAQPDSGGAFLAGVAGGSAGTASVGYLFVQSVFGRLAALERKAADTAEDVALIMGHLGIERPASRARRDARV